MQGFVNPSRETWTSYAIKDVFAFNRNPNPHTAAQALCSLGVSRCLEGNLPVTPPTLQRILDCAQTSTLGNSWVYQQPPHTEEELETQQQELWKELMGVLLALDKAEPRQVAGFLHRKRSLQAAQADILMSRYGE